MTDPTAQHPARPPARLAVRRPAAPTASLATVTHLGPAGDVRERVPVATVQGTLALDLGTLPPAPAAPDLRVVTSPAPEEQREVQVWAGRFAQATVEVLGGDRPVSQLLRWTTARVYHDLERRVRILGRTTAAPRRQRTVRAQVASVRVFQPAADCAEVSVHVRHGHRSRAIAARLERHEAGWRCVALQLG